MFVLLTTRLLLYLEHFNNNPKSSPQDECRGRGAIGRVDVQVSVEMDECGLERTRNSNRSTICYSPLQDDGSFPVCRFST